MSWRNYLKSQSTPLYTEDWIGLKRLDDEDKLHFMSVEVSSEHKIQPDITQLLDVRHVLMCFYFLLWPLQGDHLQLDKDSLDEIIDKFLR